MSAEFIARTREVKVSRREITELRKKLSEHTEIASSKSMAGLPSLPKGAEAAQLSTAALLSEQKIKKKMAFLGSQLEITRGQLAVANQTVETLKTSVFSP